jgi:enhancer of mRNA-decapping protein 3
MFRAEQAEMADQFIGSMVSIDCGDVLGMYQGLLDGVNTSTQALTIVQAYHNGTKCQVPRVTISYVQAIDLF